MEENLEVRGAKVELATRLIMDEFSIFLVYKILRIEKKQISQPNMIARSKELVQEHEAEMRESGRLSEILQQSGLESD